MLVLMFIFKDYYAGCRIKGAKESSLSRLVTILTNNVRFEVFLVFDKNKCHFQNRTILPKFVMIF